MREAMLALLCLSLLHAQDPAPAEPPATYARVTPLRSLVVRSRIDATVARLSVQVGEQVKELAQLAALSAPDLTAGSGQADQDLFTAEKELDVVVAEEHIARLRHGLAQRQLRSAEQSLGADKAALDVATQLLEDLKRRAEAGRGGTDVRDAQVALNKRHAEVREAEAKLQDVRDELAIAAHEQERATAVVVVQRSRIDAARAAREAMRVRAEMVDVKNLLPGARVSRLFVGEGDLVAPGTPLLELVDDSKVILQIFVPAHLAARVRAGTAITVRAADGAPADLQAKVARVSRVLDAETQTMLVEAELDNSEGRWLTGLQLPVGIAEGVAR